MATSNEHLTPVVRRLVGLAMAGVLLLAACGTEGGEVAGPEDGTVDITASDYAFTGVPATIRAGDTLTLTNTSEVELHELVAIRIRDGVDLSVGEIFDLPEEEADELLAPGPPATVLIAPPGQDSFAVVGDGSLVEPGRYALACFIPTGADPEEFMAAAEAAEEGPPQVEGGPPHFVHGMYAELTVE